MPKRTTEVKAYMFDEVDISLDGFYKQNPIVNIFMCAGQKLANKYSQFYIELLNFLVDYSSLCTLEICRLAKR